MPTRLVGLALGLLVAASLRAAPRTFVASGGLDTNPCSRPAPCRSFATAIAATDIGGEMIVLDSAGYGPVLITQSVILIAPDGVYAGVTATAGEGITVTLAFASDRVVLTGLAITGAGAANGIHFTSIGKLRIDQVRVSDFTTSQIVSDGGGSLSIDHSMIRGTRAGVSSGILVTAPAPSAGISISNTRVEDGLNCVLVEDNVFVTVVDTVVNNCSQRAFRVVGSGDLTLERVTAANSQEGLLTGCGAGIARISNSTFTGNGTGVRACGGTIFTRGNNTFGGNVTDVDNATTLTPLAAQ